MNEQKHNDYGALSNRSSTKSLLLAQYIAEHDRSLEDEHPVRSFIFILSPIMLSISLIALIYECRIVAFLLFIVALHSIFVSQTRMLQSTQALSLLVGLAFALELVESIISLRYSTNHQLIIRVIALSLLSLNLCLAHTLVGYERLTDARAVDMYEAEQSMISEIQTCHELEEERQLLNSHHLLENHTLKSIAVNV